MRWQARSVPFVPPEKHNNVSETGPYRYKDGCVIWTFFHGLFSWYFGTYTTCMLSLSEQQTRGGSAPAELGGINFTLRYTQQNFFHDAGKKLRTKNCTFVLLSLSKTSPGFRSPTPNYRPWFVRRTFDKIAHEIIQTCVSHSHCLICGGHFRH